MSEAEFLGEGWPDLFLARSRDTRLLAVECKRLGAKPTPMQAGVHEILRASGLDVRVWSPAVRTEIEATLR